MSSSSAVKESVLVRPDTPRSEDLLGVKWDRCLADTAIKMAGGLALGTRTNEKYYRVFTSYCRDVQYYIHRYLFFLLCIPGGFFSFVLFRRRAWPLIFGMGSGFGMGYANCQHEFRAGFETASKAAGSAQEDNKKKD